MGVHMPRSRVMICVMGSVVHSWVGKAQGYTLVIPADEALCIKSCCGSIMTVHSLGILDCTTWLGLFYNIITGEACMQTASPTVGNVWCVRQPNPVLMFYQEHCSHYQCRNMFVSMQVWIL